MRTRKIGWRNRAYEYIMKNGPATAGELVESVRQKNGRPFKNRGPHHANGASQLLMVDKRFTYTKTKMRYTQVGGKSILGGYYVNLWRIADEE